MHCRGSELVNERVKPTTENTLNNAMQRIQCLYFSQEAVWPEVLRRSHSSSWSESTSTPNHNDVSILPGFQDDWRRPRRKNAAAGTSSGIWEHRDKHAMRSDTQCSYLIFNLNRYLNRKLITAKICSQVQLFAGIIVQILTKDQQGYSEMLNSLAFSILHNWCVYE